MAIESPPVSRLLSLLSSRSLAWLTSILFFFLLLLLNSQYLTCFLVVLSCDWFAPMHWQAVHSRDQSEILIYPCFSVTMTTESRWVSRDYSIVKASRFITAPSFHFRLLFAIARSILNSIKYSRGIMPVASSNVGIADQVCYLAFDSYI